MSVSLVAFLVLLCSPSCLWSLPMPQTLTEEQFRSFDSSDDDGGSDKQVKIVSGYSNVSQNDLDLLCYEY